jgi:peptide deformylase
MIKLLDYRVHPKELSTPGKLIDLTDISSQLFKNNIAEMKTILAKDGVGLAATQVGWSVQLFMLCINEVGETVEPQIFVNPKIKKWSTHRIKMEEGCLSAPGLWLKLARPSEVVWTYTDLAGKRHEKHSTGFYARAVQHEIDHLNGRMFLTRATPAQKLRVKKWLQSI